MYDYIVAAKCQGENTMKSHHKSPIKQEDIIPLTLRVSDLKSIGHTTYQGKQGTNFVCSLDLANIEEIILRNIITHVGYEVDNGTDRFSKEDLEFPDEIEFATTLPWDEYQRITKP